MRTYLVFGSTDERQWDLIGEYEASGASQARSHGLDAMSTFEHYAAVPKRNWSSASPEVVQRTPVVRWKDATPGQMTVEDVLAQAEDAGLIEEVPAPDERMTRRADTAGL